MGFSVFEKASLKSVVADDGSSPVDHFPAGIAEFIKNQNLGNQISNYGRFPRRKNRVTAAENIELTRVFDQSFSVSETVE